MNHKLVHRIVTHIIYLGLSLDELWRTHMRVGKLGTQVVAKQIGMYLIQRFAKPFGTHCQRKPRVLATRQMVALRPSFAALAAFAARQLLEAAMQFFHLPAHVGRILNDLPGQGGSWVIRHNPLVKRKS
jgi:hypothetical protein